MYQDFVERLMSQLALRGTEITNKKMEDENSRMDVKYIDEVGKMFITVDGENVKVVYEVQRDRKEVKRGLRGALTGGGIGGLLGGVLRKSDDVEDRVVDTVSGAIAGGAYEAYEGYEESKEERTRFAEELADIFIRLVNLCEVWNIDLEEEVRKKHHKNLSRPYLHGRHTK